jgi:hypothetical protein
MDPLSDFDRAIARSEGDLSAKSTTDTDDFRVSALVKRVRDAGIDPAAAGPDLLEAATGIKAPAEPDELDEQDTQLHRERDAEASRAEYGRFHPAHVSSEAFAKLVRAAEEGAVREDLFGDEGDPDLEELRTYLPSQDRWLEHGVE